MLDIDSILVSNQKNNIVKILPSGNFDIVGDVHGEYESLLALIEILGYDVAGNHPEGRMLVFIGDLCDRGLNSPAVLRMIMDMVCSNKAFLVLGNHEINLLANEVKDGAGWFFEAQYAKDVLKYGACHQVQQEEKLEIINFLREMPLVLMNDELKIVHACWDETSLQEIIKLGFNSVIVAYEYYKYQIKSDIRSLAWYPQYLKDREIYELHGRNPNYKMPLLVGMQEYDLNFNQLNMVRILTSGHERKVDTPFFVGGRWRFTSRVRWWDYYMDSAYIVFGHYWRLLSGSNEIFSEPPLAWLGKERNTFCNDYSIGALWRDRGKGFKKENSKYHLAALRWPEKELVLETGKVYLTDY